MGANLELLARLLVDVRRPVDGEFLDPGRQGNRSANPGAGALGRGHDLLRRSVEHPVIERLQTDADVLRVHFVMSLPAWTGRLAPSAGRNASLGNRNDDAR